MLAFEASLAYHLRFAQHRALGRKVSDEFIVPLCRGHHREVHRSGDEAAWWSKAGIDPIGAAGKLWTETHPLRSPLKPRTLMNSTASRAATSDFSIRSAAVQRPPKSQNKANYRGWRSMTSFRQIEANRRNACKSTGPITEEGKQRSRCNAVRHGLTAETVIGALEDAEDYKAFEAALIADYDAQSAVERELVLRLASLLWRLRRATTVETGLFEIQADYVRPPACRPQIRWGIASTRICSGPCPETDAAPVTGAGSCRRGWKRTLGSALLRADFLASAFGSVQRTIRPR